MMWKLKVRGIPESFNLTLEQKEKLEQLKLDHSIPDTNNVKIEGIGVFEKGNIVGIYDVDEPMLNRSKNNDTDEKFELWQKEKREFLKLSSSEKAKQTLSSFNFVYINEYHRPPTSEESTAFLKRAEEWFKNSTHNGRMYPNPEIYIPELIKTNNIMFQVWQNDIREQKFYA